MNTAPPLTAEQADKLNNAAEFLPRPECCTTDPDCGCGALPCVEIGGVQVYAYADPEVGLVVALNFDTAAPPLTADNGLVPVQVVVGCATVYAADRHAHVSVPWLADDATDLARAVDRSLTARRTAHHGAADLFADEVCIRAADLVHRIGARP